MATIFPMTERERKTYFIRRMTGGKSAVARVADRILLLAFTYFGTLPIWFGHPSRFFLSAIAAVVAEIILMLIFRNRLNHFIARERSHIVRTLLLEKMMLLPDEKQREMLGADATAILLVRQSEIDLDTFVHACNCHPNASACYMTADMSAEVRRFIHSNLSQMIIVEKEEVFRMLAESASVNGEEIDGYLSDTVRDGKRSKKQRPYFPAGLEATARLLLVGVAILLLSMLSPYVLYCRLLACAAFIAAGFSGITQYVKKKAAPI